MNTKLTRSTRCAVVSTPSIESLETRALLSAPYDFAAVGFRFDANSPAVFEMLGHLAADGAVTGSQTRADLANAPVSGPIDWASLDILSRGRFTTSPRTGVDPYTEQLGSKFIWDDGYAHGSFAAMLSGGATDVSFLIQRKERTIDWTSTGRYEYQYLELGSQGLSILSGQFTFAEEGVAIWSDSADGQNQYNVAVNSQDAFGSLFLANGRNVHASPNYYTTASTPDLIYPPADTVLMVDTDASDGKIGIGLARRFADGNTFGSAGWSGTYRATILTGGALGDDFFNASPVADDIALAQVAIELSHTGDYRIYDLAGYDAGDRTVIASGTWAASNAYIGSRGAFITLTSPVSGAKARFMMGLDTSLTAYTVENADASVVEPLLGSISSYRGHAAQRNTSGGHVGLNDDGHPIFYSSVTADANLPDEQRLWYAEDLLENWGGEPLIAVESRVALGFSAIHIVIGISADGDVHVWDQIYGGVWQHRNLTEELAASGLVSDITIFDYRDLTVFPWESTDTLAVAGKNADGDLVLYTPSPQRDAFGVYAWNAVNVSDDGLTPHSQDTPVWTGAVQGYQTTWGGMNVVGIDAAGDLVVAWTAPGLDGWRTTNISDLAGSPAFVGSLSVIMTSWSGIHIHALDAQGDLHSTWWVPQFGGDWEHNNLTDELAGPSFDTSRNTDRTEAFTTFVGVGNTLNIVGFDSNGRVRVYWWSPQTNVWLVGDLTDSFPPSEAPLGFSAADHLGSMDPDGPYAEFGQSLYGYNADGTFSRVWWAADGPDLWHVQNLTEEAIPVLS